MEMLKRLEPVWLALVLIGALNWGIVGLFDENVLANVFGTGGFTDAVYTVIGLSGVMLLPRLLEGMQHMGGSHAHPHGA